MWIKYNPNPAGRTVGDCAVRAVAKALKVDWETAYELIACEGYKMADMPSSDSVWGAVLRNEGFYRKSIPDKCHPCYSVRDFCYDNPVGTFVLGIGGHVVTVVDGDIYDSWDSSDAIPQFVWYRKD